MDRGLMMGRLNRNADYITSKFEQKLRSNICDGDDGSGDGGGGYYGGGDSGGDNWGGDEYTYDPAPTYDNGGDSYYGSADNYSGTSDYAAYEQEKQVAQEQAQAEADAVRGQYDNGNGPDDGTGSGAPARSGFGQVLSTIGDVVSGRAFGGGIVGSLVSTALTGLALRAVQGMLNPATNTANDSNPAANTVTDKGQIIQIPASQDNKIPILYGRATLAGYITEVMPSNSNQTMTYVITLSEKTGPLMSDSSASAYKFEKIYWNDFVISFQNDGITAAAVTDRTGTVDTGLNGLAKFWCYAGGSSSAYMLSPVGYSASPVNAWSIVPGWTSAMTMDDLVFMVVQVTYNRELGITGLPNITATVSNSLTMPGDVLYDYMTSTRYGAAIPSADIYTS